LLGQARGCTDAGKWDPGTVAGLAQMPANGYGTVAGLAQMPGKWISGTKFRK
jgi:hypothetical protein